MKTYRPVHHFSARHWIELFVMSGLAFLVVILMCQTLFRGQIQQAEEGSLLFQAEVFLSGTLRRQAGDLAPLVDYPSVLTDQELGWFSRYSSGHAVWLTVGNAFGYPYLMSAIAAACTVAAGYGMGLRLRMPRFLVPVLIFLSPFFWFTHSSLLRDSSAMAFSSLMLFFYVRGRQERNNLNLFVSGLLWSGLFLITPVPAVLLGIPFLIDTLWILYRNPGNHGVWRSLMLILVAVGLGVLFTKTYNDLMTGHTSVSPFEQYGANEGWGFGERRTQGGDVESVDHSLRRGITLMVERGKALDRWLLGAFPGFILCWLALWGHGWNRRWSGLLLSTVLAVFVGHVGFWDSGISSRGPLHSAEVLPFLLVGGGLGLSRIWRKMSTRRAQRLAVFGLLLTICMVSAFPFWMGTLLNTQARLAETVEISQMVDDLEKPALLFLPPDLREDRLLFLNIALNRLGFDTPVLRLQSEEDDRPGLVACFPERTPYVLTSLGRIIPYDEPFEGYVRAAANSHRSRGTGSNEGEIRIADAAVHSEGYLFFGWYPYLPPGEYECRFDLRWSGVEEDEPLYVEVVKNLGRTVIVRKTLSPGLEEAVVRFRLDRITQVEPRVYFGGSGEAILRHVDLVPVPLTDTELATDPIE